MEKKKAKKSQKQKFIEAAKEHGCDESEKAFEKKLKGLFKVRSKPRKKKQED